MSKILVLGWNGSGNIGDDLFEDAFSTLFPGHQFIYTQNISANILINIDCVFIGGGSLLDGEPAITLDALELLKNHNVIYIGVGAETNIHPVHIQLMKQAKLIAIRSNHIDKIKQINPNVICIPDLVYALKSNKQKIPIKKSLLILPNIEVVPKGTDQNWKHSSWQYFKSEFSQFLDWAIDNKYTISFFSMCNNNKMSDYWAATEIINCMTYRNCSYTSYKQINCFSEIVDYFGQYETIITQRFHGVILAEILNKPYIAIHHHDKIKECFPGRGNFIPYYELSKNKLINNLTNINQINEKFYVDFTELIVKVNSIIEP